MCICIYNEALSRRIYIYIYIYIHIHTHIHTYVYIHAYIHAHTHTHAHTYVYIHICTYMYVCIYTYYVYTYVCTYTRDKLTNYGQLRGVYERTAAFGSNCESVDFRILSKVFDNGIYSTILYFLILPPRNGLTNQFSDVSFIRKNTCSLICVYLCSSLGHGA